MKCPIVYFPLIALLLFHSLKAEAQVKRELRGVWITTQYNLDWPSKPGLEAPQQKNELIAIMDRLERLNFNAVFFQIRGAGDALYPSQEAPWSKALSGKEGSPPSPLYDPLKFAQAESRKRGFEFHAWMNPFRISMQAADKRDFHSQHVYRKHPEWCLEYGGKIYLDPGIPEVRTHLMNVIAEVLNQYEPNGLHFDDYFYPYPSPGMEFPDSLSYKAFNPDSLELGEWRRANINRFIRDVRELVLEISPEIKFGVSPFGVWRNREDDPGGSLTRAGIRSYDVLFADVKYWLDEGLLDYVVPQIYFSTQYGPANFNTLVDWWDQNKGLAELYIGHALYKVNNNADQRWADPNELLVQIEKSRQKAGGSVFFREKFLEQNPLAVTDSLQKGPYSYPALLPETYAPKASKPLYPIQMEIQSRKEGLILTWEQERKQGDYYAIYRSRGKAEPDTNKAPLFEVHHGSENRWVDSSARLLKKYHYRITHLNRHHQESSPSEKLSIRHKWGWKQWWKSLFKK